jgi:Uma2 family endonuclease
MYDDNDEIGKVEEAAPKYNRFMSPSQFLEWEDRQERRYEYIEGEIIEVKAASLNHSRVSSNIVREVGTYLKGKSCEILTNVLRISAKSMRSYFYPDASVFCNEPEPIDISGETYKNPTAIFEVLSPSTADLDMGRKMFFYMQIDSLREYIIIDSRKVEVHKGRRQADNAWKFETLNSSNDVLQIECIGMSLRLAEIYEGVKFA